MARILPILSPHSQFPYPYDKPLFLASCRIRSGKMNAWKRRYICISRNCLYYYLNEEGLLDQAAGGGQRVPAANRRGAFVEV